MAITEKVFIPLPELQSIRIPPNKTLVLGTILTNPKKPRQPLCSTPVQPVEEAAITKDTIERPWRWDSRDHKTGQAGIKAIISAMPGLGAGAEAGGSSTKDEAIVFDSQNVLTEYFAPDSAYHTAVTKNPVVAAYAKKMMKPPVFLVTAIMTAKSAEIEIVRGKNKSSKAAITAEAASVGSLGAQAERGRESGSTVTTTLMEPFVLAYELLELRINWDGTASAKSYNKPALFDDRRIVVPDLDGWRITEVTSEQVWGDD